MKYFECYDKTFFGTNLRMDALVVHNTVICGWNNDLISSWEI